MTALKTAFVLTFAILALFWVSGGSAQQDSVGDLGLAVRQGDLDAYWLDTREWYWYGYRPYTKAHLSRFAPEMPTWSTARRGGYSYGINESPGDAPWEGGPKATFQLTKYGTWH